MENEANPPVETRPDEPWNDFEERVLFSWTSPERVHKARTKEFYSTIVVLAVLISIIMFFIEGMTPVLMVWAVVFLAWVISKTPPARVEHQITNLGIRTGGGIYGFGEMLYFWVEEKWGEKVLRVSLSRGFPNMLSIIINPADETKVRKLMVEYGVRLFKPAPTFLDKAVRWFSEKVPLE